MGEKNYNGFWMLFGLVVMLTLPVAIGYFTLAPAAGKSMHADAVRPH